MVISQHIISKVSLKMNNIAIARRLRGITTKALADRLGVTCQQVGNWECGFRNPNRSAARQLADELDVDIAWIMDCPQPALIRDPLTGDMYACKIMRSEQIDGYGTLYHLYIGVTGDIVALIIAGCDILTTVDWQGLQPQNATEIAEYRWMDGRGNDAIMVDGLPRVFA